MPFICVPLSLSLIFVPQSSAMGIKWLCGGHIAEQVVGEGELNQLDKKRYKNGKFCSTLHNSIKKKERGDGNV